MLTAFKKFCWLPLLAAVLTGRGQTFRVTIAPTLHSELLDGRLLLLLSNNNKQEPRFQINDAAGTQMIFGVDVEGWQPGEFAAGRYAGFRLPVKSD